MTQSQRVLERAMEKGYVDNFWAVHNYILRLGAIIHELRKEGYEIEGEYGEGVNRKNYYYHFKKYAK